MCERDCCTTLKKKTIFSNYMSTADFILFPGGGKPNLTKS